MDKNQRKRARRGRRKRGVRKRVFGTPDRPRLTVFRSNKHIYAQAIDDVSGHTLASAGTAGMDKTATVDSARAVGATLAENARSAGIQSVRFDRSGYKYHGRVRALADAAREGGLQF